MYVVKVPAVIIDTSVIFEGIKVHKIVARLDVEIELPLDETHSTENSNHHHQLTSEE